MVRTFECVMTSYRHCNECLAALALKFMSGIAKRHNGCTARGMISEKHTSSLSLSLESNDKSLALPSRYWTGARFIF